MKITETANGVRIQIDERGRKTLLIVVDEEKEQISIYADRGRIAVFPSAHNSIVVKVER